MSETNLLEDYLTKTAAAKALKKSERTMDRWARLRIGPPRTMIGSTVFYRISALIAWLKAQERVQPRQIRK